MARSKWYCSEKCFTQNICLNVRYYVVLLSYSSHHPGKIEYFEVSKSDHPSHVPLTHRKSGIDSKLCLVTRLRLRLSHIETNDGNDLIHQSLFDTAREAVWYWMYISFRHQRKISNQERPSPSCSWPPLLFDFVLGDHNRTIQSSEALRSRHHVLGRILKSSELLRIKRWFNEVCWE